jgi:serine/threonine protein kinase
MPTSATPIAVCSACGEPLNGRGDCIACLIRAGIGGDDQSPDGIESSATILDRSAALSSAERLDRYRIVREIGRGRMGAVYLAERADKQFKKQVAIKLIKRGMDTDAALRQFWKERQILAGFDHANIARLFDGDTTEDGLPYFIMEYVEGLPINDYCTKHSLSISERLKLFREICAGVSYAHRHLVIHRDIKPSNILVTSEGLRRMRLDASISLGDAYSGLAAVDSNVSSTDRRNACEMYQWSSEIMRELQSRGTLAADAMSEMAELDRKIAECAKLLSQ